MDSVSSTFSSDDGGFNENIVTGKVYPVAKKSEEESEEGEEKPFRKTMTPAASAKSTAKPAANPPALPQPSSTLLMQPQQSPKRPRLRSSTVKLASTEAASAKPVAEVSEMDESSKQPLKRPRKTLTKTATRKRENEESTVVYEVINILGQKFISEEGILFFIEWKNVNRMVFEPTWEPQENLVVVDSLLPKFLNKMDEELITFARERQNGAAPKKENGLLMYDVKDIAGLVERIYAKDENGAMIFSYTVKWKGRIKNTIVLAEQLKYCRTLVNAYDAWEKATRHY